MCQQIADDIDRAECGHFKNINLRLEYIDCPLCAGKNYSVVMKSRDFRYHLTDNLFEITRCRNCGFAFLNPRPQAQELRLFYPDNFSRKDDSILYKIICPCFKIIEKQTIAVLKKYKKSGKTLDIGCGNGNFLLKMQEAGFDAWGVDPDQGAKNFTSVKLSGKIFYQELRDCNFLSQSFDIITMFHSLEHIADLSGTLKEVSRVIKPDGILYICVPNQDFFEFRYFGPYSYNLEVPRHLSFFTKNTLSQLLRNYGFNKRKFIKGSIFEIVVTPASFYHSLVYFLADRGVALNDFFNFIIFLPLVLIRALVRFLFLFSGQEIKVLCQRE